MFEFRLVELDYSPFIAAANELYHGPWVAERYLAAQDLLEHRPEVLHPVTRDIIAAGADCSAIDVFSSMYRLADLRSAVMAQLTGVDALLTPTAGAHFSIDAVAAEPVQRNTDLGYYTNYMNLLDLAGLALPGSDTDAGMPFGVTLVADHQQDRRLLSIGALIDSALRESSGLVFARPVAQVARQIPIVVCGAHLSGLPLNPQLTGRGATLMEATRSAPGYRLFALPGGPPYRPAMVRDPNVESQIELEVWSLPAEQWGSFVSNIPAPLGIGKVELENGASVSGFVCEHDGIAGAQEITTCGGWRAYIRDRMGD